MRPTYDQKLSYITTPLLPSLLTPQSTFGTMVMIFSYRSRTEVHPCAPKANENNRTNKWCFVMPSSQTSRKQEALHGWMQIRFNFHRPTRRTAEAFIASLDYYLRLCMEIRESVITLLLMRPSFAFEILVKKPLHTGVRTARHCLITVSYTHLTLPTICSV